MSDPEFAVEVADLSKHFGAATALNGVQLQVRTGTFLTIFGPNGAGKTTLMRILAALARPTSGSAKIFGRDVASARATARRRVGLVTHRSLLYAALSAYDNVLFFARMFGVADAEQRTRQVLAEVGLEHRMHDAVHSYSRGMEQRCAIARALVHRPDLVLFDEPFSGLDPDASGRLQELLQQHRERSATVIVTSHDLSRGADQADRIAILRRGRIVFDAPASDVVAGSMADVYREHTTSGAQ